MTILALTHRGDDMRAMLDELPALARRAGADLVLADTDRFPGEIDLEARFEPTPDGRAHLGGFLEIDGRRLLLDEISAVWHRRQDVGAALPQSLDPQLRVAALRESEAVLLGTLAALDCFHLDPEVNRRLARTKPLQLEWARRAGLLVPRTITSNDPAALREFAAKCDGDVVFKMLENYIDPDRPGRATVFTNRVAPGQLDDDAALSLVPVTLQERIEKAVELRAIVVGNVIHAAGLRSQDSALAKDDWRRDGAGLLDAWSPATLDPTVERGLLALMDRLGLQYGAADLIVRPNGETVFLEVNPMGEFFWLEQHLGFPIRAGIVDLLAGRAPRRPQFAPLRMAQ